MTRVKIIKHYRSYRKQELNMNEKTNTTEWNKYQNKNLRNTTQIIWQEYRRTLEDGLSTWGPEALISVRMYVCTIIFSESINCSAIRIVPKIHIFHNQPCWIKKIYECTPNFISIFESLLHHWKKYLFCISIQEMAPLWFIVLKLLKNQFGPPHRLFYFCFSVN